MLARLVPRHRAVGTLGGDIGTLYESQTGINYYQPNLSITSPDVDDTIVYEYDSGGGYEEKSLAAIQAATYARSNKVRAKLRNSTFGVEGPYTSEATGQVDKIGGSGTETITANDIELHTAPSFSVDGAITTVTWKVQIPKELVDSVEAFSKSWFAFFRIAYQDEFMVTQRVDVDTGQVSGWFEDSLVFSLSEGAFNIQITEQSGAGNYYTAEISFSAVFPGPVTAVEQANFSYTANYIDSGAVSNWNLNWTP